MRARPAIEATQFVNTLSTSDGGPARNSFELNLALNAAGVPTALVVVDGKEEGSVAISGDDVLPTPGPLFLRSRSEKNSRQLSPLSAWKRIRSSNVVIIHGYYLLWAPLVALACIIQRRDFVIMPHGALTAHQQLHSRLRKRLFDVGPGRLLRRVSLFAVGSEREKSELALRFPKTRIVVVGAGTRLNRDAPESRGPNSPIRLLSMSRIAPKKRIDLMVRALSELESLGIAAELWIAGEGDPALKAQLAHLAETLGVDTRVTFLGVVAGAEKETLYGKADLFLLPSDDENFGIGLAEALAHGLPSVVSANVAAGSFMEGRGGRVIAEPDGVSIALAIQELLSEDWATLRNDAFEVARRSFSWESVAGRWIHQINSLVRP